jgi:hypothetical protein
MAFLGIIALFSRRAEETTKEKNSSRVTGMPFQI